MSYTRFGSKILSEFSKTGNLVYLKNYLLNHSNDIEYIKYSFDTIAQSFIKMISHDVLSNDYIGDNLVFEVKELNRKFICFFTKGSKGEDEQLFYNYGDGLPIRAGGTPRFDEYVKQNTHLETYREDPLSDGSEMNTHFSKDCGGGMGVYGEPEFILDNEKMFLDDSVPGHMNSKRLWEGKPGFGSDTPESNRALLERKIFRDGNRIPRDRIAITHRPYDSESFYEAKDTIVYGYDRSGLMDKRKKVLDKKFKYKYY